MHGHLNVKYFCNLFKLLNQGVNKLLIQKLLFTLWLFYVQTTL